MKVVNWFFCMILAVASAEGSERDVVEFGHSDFSEAHGHLHGSHSECPIPKSVFDVVRCARAQSPRAKRSALSVKESLGLSDVARQIPNPDIDLQSGWGNLNGVARSNVQLGIRQPIEWGGRRAARLKAAEAEQNQLSTEQSATDIDITIETILKLHRVRQIELEKQAMRGTSNALTKLIRQYQARKALSPDLKGALAVYKLALADANIRLSEIFEEERELEHYFHVATGNSLAELSSILPPAPTTWPNLQDQMPNALSSPGLKLAQANFGLADARLSSAFADSWPKLNIGPQITFDRDGSNTGTLFGVSMAMEIPVFHLNGAGRSLARGGLVRAEAIMELVKSEELHERSEQLRIYRNALETIKNSPTVAQIEKEHLSNEQLAEKGFISGSLLVESYRQRNDLIKGRNGRELKAIAALWQVYKFDGRVMVEAP